MPNSFAGRDVISIKDFTKAELLEVLREAKKLKKQPAPKLLNGLVLGCCFYEPSTRTRLSFETAMQRLGGQVVGFADPKVTSVKKGENLWDTTKIIGQYVDAIVMRHPLDGAARRAADATNKPIINAGDGANQHPTQTLLDLFTILETQKKLDNLNIIFAGDLKYGRTIHSLAQALTHFNARIYCVAPDALQMPEYILNELKSGRIKFSLHKKIEEVIPKADIIYLTRIQEERFADAAEYEKVKNAFLFNAALLKNAKPNLKVMHPLPRVNELAMDVDNTKHANYFEQAENGLYVREAILGLVLGKL